MIVNGKSDDRWAAHHGRTRVIPDGVASVVTGILEDNVRYGTGTAAALDRPVAGKTGTTDKHADAWFVGYTPGLSTAVWMGYTRGEVPMTNVHGISVSGGSFPAEIWRRFMYPALARLPARDFPQPHQPVTFHSWHRGPSALGYDPYYTAPATPAPTTTQDTTTSPSPTTAPPATAPAAKPARTCRRFVGERRPARRAVRRRWSSGNWREPDGAPTRRRITPSGHGPTFGHCRVRPVRPAWSGTPGRHANYRSTI